MNGAAIARRKARTFEMHAHLDRIVESIVFLVLEGQARRRAVTQYDIVKSIFLADRSHLNRYGRPITYDNYVAMKDGPVPSAAYDFLKENPLLLSRYGQPLPWVRKPAPHISKSAFSYEDATRPANEDILSPSDMEALADALTVVQSLGFKQVRKLTHEDQAYLDAWEDEGPENSAYPMSYSLLFDTPNEEKARELSDFSKYV